MNVFKTFSDSSAFCLQAIANKALEEAGSAAQAVDDGLGVVVIAVAVAAGTVAPRPPRRVG